MPVIARDKAGTSRDKQGQGRDKQGQGRDKQGQTGPNRDSPLLSVLVGACPCLSLFVLVCPCLSLSVPVSPCLSLSLPLCLYICYTCISCPADDFHSHHQCEYSNSDFAFKSHCSNASSFLSSSVFFNLDLSSSVNLSFNPNSSILVIYFTKGSTF